MSEMLDRVATAIEQAFKDRVSASAGQPFEKTGVVAPGKDVWTAYARAAVEAMRHPNGDMVEAGHTAHPNTYGVGAVMAAVHYRAMIDEALK